MENNKVKVLVAIDESDGSFHALKWSLENLLSSNSEAFGSSLEEAQEDSSSSSIIITLLNVQPVFQPFLYPAGPGFPIVYATPAVIEAVKKAQEANAATILARALHICKQMKKVKAETLVLKGDPKDKICQAAEELGVDFVVVGSRGLGTIKRALLGSVSNYCAHHVHCPVLIVKPPPKSSAHDS